MWQSYLCSIRLEIFVNNILCDATTFPITYYVMPLSLVVWLQSFLQVLVNFESSLTERYFVPSGSELSEGWTLLVRFSMVVFWSLQHLFTGRSRNKTGTALAVALPLVAAVLALTLVCLCFLRRKRRPSREHTLSCKLPWQFGTVSIGNRMSEPTYCLSHPKNSNSEIWLI
jgi:hypothetical protein